MKTLKSLITLTSISLFAAGLALAAGEAAPAPKAAGCCAKAAKDGKTCEHACCVAAAKEGHNCAKCGGSGDLPKPATKK